MNLMINVFFMVWLTSLTGVCVQIIWIIASKIFVRGNPLFVYVGLRFVCVSYLLPAAYIVIWLHFRSTFYSVEGRNYNFGKMLELTPFSEEVFEIAAIIWICLLAVFLGYRLLIFFKWKDFIHDCREEDDEYVLKKAEEYKKQLNLEKNVLVYRSVDIVSPMCTGVFLKRIVLPEEEYKEKEIEIALLHEMTHLKKHDLEIKWLSVIITMFHCFNPMAYFLYNQITKWSEVRCDIYTCEEGKGIFSSRKYYEVIIKLVKEKQQKKKFPYIMSSLVEKSSDIGNRVSCMRWHNNVGNRGKTIAATGMVAVLLIGIIASCIAGARIIQKYDKYINTSFISVREPTKVWKEEKIYNIEEKWKCADIMLEQEEESVNLYIGRIEPDLLYKGKKIYKEKGSNIQISAALLEPVGDVKEHFTIGIIEPDGTGRYISDFNILEYNFEVEESGEYSVFIRNDSFSDISVKIMYY